MLLAYKLNLKYKSMDYKRGVNEDQKGQGFSGLVLLNLIAHCVNIPVQQREMSGE